MNNALLRLRTFVYALGELDPDEDVDMRALVADARSYREDVDEVEVRLTEAEARVTQLEAALRKLDHACTLAFGEPGFEGDKDSDGFDAAHRFARAALSPPVSVMAEEEK